MIKSLTQAVFLLLATGLSFTAFADNPEILSIDQSMKRISEIIPVGRYYGSGCVVEMVKDRYSVRNVSVKVAKLRIDGSEDYNEMQIFDIDEAEEGSEIYKITEEIHEGVFTITMDSDGLASYNVFDRDAAEPWILRTRLIVEKQKIRIANGGGQINSVECAFKALASDRARAL